MIFKFVGLVNILFWGDEILDLTAKRLSNHVLLPFKMAKMFCFAASIFAKAHLILRGINKSCFID